MSTSTIGGLTLGSSGNLTGAALVEAEDALGASVHYACATLRTMLFAGGTGYTASDPLVIGRLSSAVTLAAGTYQAMILAAASADRDIFQAGVNGVSNGFTVGYKSSAMVYTLTGLGGGTGIISVGSSDSGGSGFRALRVPN